MPHTLRASLDSFQPSSIKALVPVVYSLTIQFGSLQNTLRRLFTNLTFRPGCQDILLAQSYLRISSRKWQFLEYVWSKIISQSAAPAAWSDAAGILVSCGKLALWYVVTCACALLLVVITKLAWSTVANAKFTI